MEQTVPTIHFLSDPSEILAAVNEVRQWVTDQAQHVEWTGSEFPYGQAIEAYPEGQHPLEACLCRHQQRVVAYAEIHHNQFGWVIARMLVHPQHRGAGFGAFTLNHTLNRLFLKFPTASLFVKTDNAPAISFYQSFGFVMKLHYPDDDVYKMELEKGQHLSIQLGRRLAKAGIKPLPKQIDRKGQRPAAEKAVRLLNQMLAK